MIITANQASALTSMNLNCAVKQELEISSGTRAGVQKGFDPGDF